MESQENYLDLEEIELETLKSLKDKLQGKMARCDAEKQECLAKLTVIEEEEARIKKDLERVLGLLREEIDSTSTDLQEQTDEKNAGKEEFSRVKADSVEQYPPPTGAGAAMLDAAEEILRNLGGKQLHYRELAAMVMARGCVVNGPDPGRTFNSHINRDSRFCRPTRKGYYALRDDYPGIPSAGGWRRPAFVPSADIPRPGAQQPQKG